MGISDFCPCDKERNSGSYVPDDHTDIAGIC